MRAFLAALLIVAALGPLATEAGAQTELCAQPERSIRTYGALRIVAFRDQDAVCRFRVTDAGDELLAEDAQAAAAVFQVDLDGDQVPELVITASAGGDEGPHNNYVLTQRPQPRLIKAFIDACAIGPRESSPGAALLKTCDLAFPGLEGLCGGCVPAPAVFITLENGILRDRSERFRAEYDADIARLRHQLTDTAVTAFLAARDRTAGAYNSDAKTAILGIVLDFLYSGREREAREALASMWPEWDRDRVWSAIVRKHQTGLLSELNGKRSFP